jgi:putative membrane protein
MLYWQFEPVPIAGLFNLSLLYLLGVGPLRMRYFPREAFPSHQALLFFTGVLILFLAVASPLHLLAEVYLLSAHMLQLSLMIYVVAPLLIAGTPSWLLAPLLTGRLLPITRALSRPLIAFVVFQTVFALWHMPTIFRTIVFNDVLHGVGYLAILAAAVLMWWPIMSPLERLPRPPLSTRFAYLGALLGAHLLLMALVGVAEEPLYPWYARAPRLFGLDPMADQELAGTIMMGFTLVALLIPMCILALRWLEHNEAPAAERRT